jgi:hypothetical protein
LSGFYYSIFSSKNNATLLHASTSSSDNPILSQTCDKIGGTRKYGGGEVIYQDNKIAPQQKSVLERPNFSQYTFVEELSIDKGTNNTPNITDDISKNIC